MTRADASDLLADPRFELLPFMGFEEQVEKLPEGARVAVTASPDKGLDLTIDRSIDLAERGFRVIPHLAARAVRSEDHLVDIADRFEAADIDDVFVPGGDNEEPAGPYASSLELLTAMDDLGYAFDDVGITGYPEGHPIIDDATLEEAMDRKAPHATYIVTQLCYDPGTVLQWLERTRGRGIELPVYVGVPGVLRYQRLLSISRKVGVGESMRFLQKTSGILGFVRQFIGSRGRYQPDDLVQELAERADDPAIGIAGVHLYTFNQVGDTESWRAGYR